jgi:hypothetical protein
MRNTQEATRRAEAAEAAVGALRESETPRHREHQATQRDLETARGECAAAVESRERVLFIGTQFSILYTWYQ